MPHARRGSYSRPARSPPIATSVIVIETRARYASVVSGETPWAEEKTTMGESDGFPRAVAIALGIALAFCVSLFVFALMGGWL